MQTAIGTDSIFGTGGHDSMQKHFQELKQQLSELSETINKFESEAVQLRIIELMFDQARSSGFGEPVGVAYEPGPARSDRPHQRSKAKPARQRQPAASSAAPSASGAVAALTGLVDSDFFNEKRTIGDVVQKCQEDFNVRYKSNAFSGPLSRYAKRGILKREKNADGNYVYYK